MSKNYGQRINNISGQINGVSRMIQEEKDCFEILTQLKAVRSAIDSLMNKYIEEKVESCISSNKSEDKQTLKKLFLKVNK
jgi:DNA-binding FrmR family transcriptional regulator